jgi:putative DNA primase/helicase
MLLGPKRSGKDTLRRVLESLLPKHNVCGPTLDSMSTTFGMSALVNMQLAVVGDMRHGKNTDYGVLAENILKLTGRSLFTFDRKYKDHWTGYLFCKLLIISNDRARFRDSSGALASRFITFRTRQSFYGRENRNLFKDKLQPELPGVLLWALEGLQRMRANGRLAEPNCSVQEQKQLSRDGAPVLAFVDDMLVLEPAASIGKDELHEMWSAYATANDLFPLQKNPFMRELDSATGGRARPGETGHGATRKYVVHGVRPKKAGESMAEPQQEIPF